MRCADTKRPPKTNSLAQLAVDFLKEEGRSPRGELKRFRRSSTPPISFTCWRDLLDIRAMFGRESSRFDGRLKPTSDSKSHQAACVHFFRLPNEFELINYPAENLNS
jgi:hypothetical protein